ncbi:hypothetical protein LguiB_034294 [Lonicera macranthoides]
MDQIPQNDNSGFRQYVENEFDRLLQDFDEFQKKSLLPPPNRINSSSAHSGPPPQSTTQQHLTTPLQDFEEFENAAIPANQMDPIYVQNVNNTSATGNFDTEGPHHDHYYTTQNVEATRACIGAGGTVGGSFTRYANTSTTNGSSGNGRSTRGGPIMDSVLKLANLSTCGTHQRLGVMMGSFVQYGFSVQGTVGAKAKGKATPRRRTRKYRGVYETEAQFLLRMERQKIKNRETAARSFENKQAYETHLLAQVQKLRQRNDFLKKLLAVPQPLKLVLFSPVTNLLPAEM